MISTMKEILVLLESNSIAYQLHEHPPVFTAEEAMQYCAHIPGAHVKNLFLRNQKKTAYYLVTVREDKRVDLAELAKQFNEKRLSFANANELVSLLGVQPGSVTPLAIINDESQQVKLFFDDSLTLQHDINIHPMENVATITLALPALLQFIKTHYSGKIEFIKIQEVTS